MLNLNQEIARRYGTPALVVDMDIVGKNIARLQAACDAAGLANRPHIKTHKSPLFAGLQREHGARGITCQKLGEAEVMADAGFDDILISYNLLGEEKERRLAALMSRVHMTVSADNPVVVASLSRAAGLAGRVLDVVVECDTGFKRAGVETSEEAVAVAAAIDSAPGLAFAGLLLYAPQNAEAETQAFLDATLAGLAARGLPAPRIVSTGGTPNLRGLGRIRGATEHRSGTSIFNDRMMMACGAAALEDCALTILATVVSRASPVRGIVDAGSKTLTSDVGGLDGYGFLPAYPQARIGKLSEEHGFLDLAACTDKPEIGDLVRIVPNHVCVCVNMVDRLIATQGGEIVGEIPVAARGRIV